MTEPTTAPDATRDRLTVLIAGGSSAAGTAAGRALSAAGHRVLSVGSDAGRIRAATEGIAGAVPLVCDLADPAAVAALAEDIHRDYGLVDGLVQLVGGWRGGKGLADQSDADWDFLEHSVLTTLRNTTRTFLPDIAASPCGRLAVISSTSVTAPTPGNAAYAAIKAAAETWTFAAAAELDPARGAAVVLVVKALVDAGMRAAAPDRKFPGYTDVDDLAGALAGLFDARAEAINGARLELTS
jgi:NADP-dependent 3-hydroxy acid dehydrogenase YdfG